MHKGPPLRYNMISYNFPLHVEIFTFHISLAQEKVNNLTTKKKKKKPQLGFLLRILWCSQSGDHPQINLAKFGYMLKYENITFF
jgi:hypothetical protein